MKRWTFWLSGASCLRRWVRTRWAAGRRDSSSSHQGCSRACGWLSEMESADFSQQTMCSIGRSLGLAAPRSQLSAVLTLRAGRTAPQVSIVGRSPWREWGQISPCYWSRQFGRLQRCKRTTALGVATTRAGTEPWASRPLWSRAKGLTDDKLSFTRLYGGSVQAMLFETDAAKQARKARVWPGPTTLASIRNGFAHGDPFDGLPWSGLLELIGI